MTETIKHTFCRNCTASCGLEVKLEDGRVTGVRGDREHPLTGGYFCIKGQSVVDLTNGAEGRLINSQKRLEDGSYVDVDVETATDDIAARLDAILGAHGPRSIAVYQATGAYFNLPTATLYKSWMAAIDCPNLFSSISIDCSSKWVAASRMGTFLPGKPDMDSVDVLLIVGINPLVSHVGPPFISSNSNNPREHIRNAKERGMKLIVVDPRRTETARLSDLHIQLRPGTDAMLFAGLIRLLFDAGLEDRTFCDRFAAEVEELREATLPFTVDRVAEECGVPEEQLHTLVELFGKSRKPSAGSGTGASMSRDANLLTHLIEAFNALCGGYARAGDVIHNPGVFQKRILTETVVPPSRGWESGIKARTADAGQIFGELPTALLPREILDGGEERIRALIVLGGNPVRALGEPELAKKAFESLDLLVVIDPRMTETAALADYVIAPSLMLERHDMTTYIEYWKPFAQYTPPVVTPPPGVIDDWAFFWGLASRMGLQLEFKLVTFGAKFQDIPGGFKLDMKNRPEPELFFKWLCEQSGVDFEALRENPHGLVFEYPETVVLPAPPEAAARLNLCPPDVADELFELAQRTELDDTFPVRLVTRRLTETLNSTFRTANATTRRYPENPCFVNPDDLAEWGLSPKERIRITSAAGSLVAVTAADPALRRGVVSMAPFYGGQHTGNLVSLHDNLQSISFMPLQTGIPVRIERATPCP